ncbi:MAG: ATP-dependent helicase [bacterium]|nr:ATP-dependent helicase [bacterium]
MPIPFDKQLNPEQLAVVQNGDGPCLVLAGAGSGKTRTIVYRVAYLLEHGVLPQQVLLLTFTNRASSEMLGRVESLLGRYPQGLWGGTFHSVANRILRRYASLLGYTSSFTILDEEDSCDLLKFCAKDVGVPQTKDRFPQARVLKAIISLSRNAQRSVEEVVTDRYPKFARYAETVERIAVTYADRKRAANAMDFDDLLCNLLRVLDDPHAHEQLAQQFRYVLVDEYQDTNRIQAAIVARLASAHGNVLVVGDDAQSIYSFRAADIGNILKFPEQFPNAKTFRIETNYRSTPQILNVANAVIAHNAKQFEKTLRPVVRGGARPTLVQCNTAEDEARAIAQRVLALRADGMELRDIAVLFRATHLSQYLEMELVKRDIPYDYRGGVRFFERAHVKDTLAFLKVATNPQDEAAWLRVLRMQQGIGDVGALTIIERVQAIVRQQSDGGEEHVVWGNHDLALSLRLQNGWQDFRGMIEKMVGCTEPAAMIRAVANGNYRDYLEAEHPNWQERLDDLEQLALFAEKYEKPEEFLAETSLTEMFGAERVGANESEHERMVLSTIHQSKGLEWEAVFVMGLTAAAFPNRRAMVEDNGLEEERRLFYVATTRAKNVLTLSYSLSGGYDPSYLAAPSPFIAEIPPEMLEPIGVSRVTPRMRWNDDGGDGEPVIVLDDMGEFTREQNAAKKRQGFLRDVSEL